MSYTHQAVRMSVQAGVRCVVMADGVTIGAETCPRCERAFLVARGPGYHQDSFSCDCGAVVRATEKPTGSEG